jgi:hypothetical protein
MTGLVPSGWRARGPRGGWLTVYDGCPAHWKRPEPVYTASEIERLQAENARLREVLTGTLLRDLVGFLEDCAPDEITASLTVWQQMVEAALQKEGA